MISSHIIFLIYLFFVAGVTLRIIFKRQSMSASLAWLLIIYIVPLLGALLYFTFGELQLGHRRAEKSESMREPYMHSMKRLTEAMHADDDTLPNDSLATAIQNLIHNRFRIGVLNYYDFTLISDADAIFDHILQDIESARLSILIEIYIWHSQGRVNEIERALIEAAKRGVKVKILADHAGSWRFFFSRGYKLMRAAGIEVVAALPVSPWRLALRRADLRMHRKMLIFDDEIAYTGSMNIADPKLFNTGANVGEWIDAMVRLRGAAALGLSKVFAWDWEVETNERHISRMHADKHPNQQWLATIPSGPGLGHQVITEVTLVSIYRADKEIVICTPYFVPPEPIFEALIHALRRGVEVTIIVPRRNDSRLVIWASRSFYDELLQEGAKIHLYTGGLLHTKAIIIDQQLALFGSVNLDARSLQLNFEISLALFHPQSCRAVCDLVDNYLQDTVELCPDRWHQRSFLARLRERLVFFLSPLL